MKKANTIFLILSGLLILQNFLISIGGVVMSNERTLAILMLGLIPLLIWLAVLVLSKKGYVSVTLPVYAVLTGLFGIHFYLLTTDLSYGFRKILELFGA